MNRRRKSLVRRAQQFGLPEDVALGLPRLVLRGNSSLILENHQGIAQYGDEMVRLRTSLGMLSVAGKGMTLSQMGRHDLLLRGEIRSVSFE